MFVSELDTFVRKFKQLCFEGYEAHLNLESHAGKVWAGMHVQLGEARGPLHHQQHERPQLPRRQQAANGPSRQRRRARREAARQHANDVANDLVSVEVAGTIDDEKINREIVLTNIVEVLEDIVIDKSIDIVDEETPNEDVEEKEDVVIFKSIEIVVGETADRDIEDTDDEETKDSDAEESEGNKAEYDSKDNFETSDDFSSNLGGINVFKTSTPQKLNKHGVSRSYRQNCKQCFQNSVCVDCFVDWHKENKKQYYRKY